MLVFYKKEDVAIRGYYVGVLQKLTGYRRIPCQEWVSPRGDSPENCCCYGRVSMLWTLKTPILIARKRWRHDVTMSSENSQGYLWIPCEFYSSLANQIMCNKQSALESCFPSNFVEFSSAVAKEKSKMWKVNNGRRTDDKRWATYDHNSALELSAQVH